MHLGRVFLCLCGVYFAMLLTIIIYGLLKYGHLREIIPDQSLSSPPYALYWYSAYGGFLEISILLLALLIGVCAALFGIIKSRPLEGLGFLIVAVALTYPGISVLPHFYYRGGDQTTGLYWLTHGLYDYAGAWLLTTILGFIFRSRLKKK